MTRDEIRAELIAELRQKAAELAPAGRNAFPAICGTMSSSDDPVTRPAGLYSDESTLRCVTGVMQRMLDAFEGFEIFTPSNGTEGEIFMSRWCARCARDDFDPETGEGGCPIIAYTMALREEDPDYPRDWRIGEDSQPMCVSFEARVKE